MYIFFVYIFPLALQNPCDALIGYVQSLAEKRDIRLNAIIVTSNDGSRHEWSKIGEEEPVSKAESLVALIQDSIDRVEHILLSPHLSSSDFEPVRAVGLPIRYRVQLRIAKLRAIDEAARSEVRDAELMLNKLDQLLTSLPSDHPNRIQLQGMLNLSRDKIQEAKRLYRRHF
jgi:hypothetical protein